MHLAQSLRIGTQRQDGTPSRCGKLNPHKIAGISGNALARLLHNFLKPRDFGDCYVDVRLERCRNRLTWNLPNEALVGLWPKRPVCLEIDVYHLGIPNKEAFH